MIPNDALTPAQWYKVLLATLPKDLTAEELSTFDLSTNDIPLTTTAAIPETIQRDGLWYGVLLVIHALGIVGHTVYPQPRQTQEQAFEIAQSYCERLMDHHEKHTGVRYRKIIDRK